MPFNDRPLRAALRLGTGPLLCVGPHTAGIVDAALVLGVDAPGCVTIITAVTALAGVQRVMPGVIGEYTRRIRYEVKWRPHFPVKVADVKRAKDLIS